jgi:hypothetical protein
MKAWNEDKDLKDTLKAYREYDNQDIKKEMEEFGLTSELSFKPDMSILNNFNLWAYSYEKTKENMQKLFPGYDMRYFYKLNSSQLRCDEFTTEHDGKHVVFAGCSMTAGEGIPENKLWTKKLYNRLSQDHKMSGYFNIAFPGATIMEVVIQIFKYIKLYGNPEILFVNLPDIDREYVNISSTNIKEVDRNPIDNVKVSKVNYLSIGMYMSLVEYCRSNGIKLYAYSWSTKEMSQRFIHFELDPRDYFDNFHVFTGEDIWKHSHAYTEAHKQDIWEKYYFQALDESHAGVALQDFFYHFIYNIYISDN